MLVFDIDGASNFGNIFGEVKRIIGPLQTAAGTGLHGERVAERWGWLDDHKRSPRGAFS